MRGGSQFCYNCDNGFNSDNPIAIELPNGSQLRGFAVGGLRLSANNEWLAGCDAREKKT